METDDPQKITLVMQWIFLAYGGSQIVVKNNILCLFTPQAYSITNWA